MIEELFLEYNTKEAFKEDLAAGEIQETSIVWIHDTSEIWTHNQYWSCSGQAPLGLFEELTDLENYTPEETDTISQAIAKIYARLSGPGGLKEAEDIIYKEHLYASLSLGPRIIEKNAENIITLRPHITLAGDPVEVSNVQISTGSEVIYNDTTVPEKISHKITDSARFVMTVQYKQFTKVVSDKCIAVYPFFYGTSKKSRLGIDDIYALDNKELLLDVKGDYSLELLEDDYVWLCIPQDLDTVRMVTSSGIRVPFNDPAKLTVGKAKFNCYRSFKTFLEGTFEFTIE